MFHFRYMHSFAVPTPAVVYLDPHVTDVFCVATWKFAARSNIIIRNIQRNLHDNLMRYDKTVFFKLRRAFHKKMQS